MAVKKSARLFDDSKDEVVIIPYYYAIMDISISRSNPPNLNRVLFSVFLGDIKLTESETGFTSNTEDSMHKAILTWFDNNTTRLGILSSVSSKVFKV